MSRHWVTGWTGWAGSLTNPREVFLKELDLKSSSLKPMANSAQQSKNCVLSLAEAVGPVMVLVPICGVVLSLVCACGRGIPARGWWGAHSQELGQRTDPPASRSGLSRSKVLLTYPQRKSELARGQATWPDTRRGKVNFSWICYVSWGRGHSQISGVTNGGFQCLGGLSGWQVSLSSEHCLSLGQGDEKQAHDCP